jgi:hypothetical protein
MAELPPLLAAAHPTAGAAQSAERTSDRATDGQPFTASPC